jgi:hypothetical protein
VERSINAWHSRRDAMEIAMGLSSTDLSDDQLMALARDLDRTISDETDIVTRAGLGEPAPGEKGEPIATTLLLTFLSSGAAVALFEVLKAYFSRDCSLSITFKKADGAEVRVSAKNMDARAMDEAMTRLQAILER